MKLDMNALMKAQQMQEQMARAQEAAKDEIAEASAGGGMVTARRTAPASSSRSSSTHGRSTRTTRRCSRTWCSQPRTRRSERPQAVEAKLRSQMPDPGGLGRQGSSL